MEAKRFLTSTIPSATFTPITIERSRSRVKSSFYLSTPGTHQGVGGRPENSTFRGQQQAERTSRRGRLRHFAHTESQPICQFRRDENSEDPSIK